mgnify:CR=1 FL=1
MKQDPVEIQSVFLTEMQHRAERTETLRAMTETVRGRR